MTAMLHTRTNPQTGVAEVVAQTGVAVMSDYCANLVNQCEQRRLAQAGHAAEQLAAMRAQINQLDHALTRDSSELAAEKAAAQATDAKPFAVTFPPLAYWPVSLGICTLEVFVNKYGLDGLRMTENASLAMAITMALSLFLIAKVTARTLRQRPWQWGEWGEVGLAAVCNVVLVVAVIHMAEARDFVAHEEALAQGLTAMDGNVVGFAALVVLGYCAMVFVSYQNTPPSRDGEQRVSRIHALSRELDGQWNSRVQLAREYNRLLAQAAHRLEALLHDMVERSSQFRGGSRRGGQNPSYYRQTLPIAAVKPIHLGEMIDPEPSSIKEVVTAHFANQETK